jgi:hypothetical protein
MPTLHVTVMPRKPVTAQDHTLTSFIHEFLLELIIFCERTDKCNLSEILTIFYVLQKRLVVTPI